MLFMSKNLWACAFSLALLAGCSEVEKLNDMKTTTGDMKTVTDELYDTLRQGNSLQLRREAYESVLKAPTLFKKISEANKYMMSFEFQIWNKIGQDKEVEKRDLLGQQAAMEFFMEMEELAPQGDIDPLAEPDADKINSAENRSASFNAMALSMHQVNRKQARAIEQNPEEKQMSLYSMMEDALLTPRNVAQKGYEREVLAHEALAIKMLQARYNVFPLVFVDSVSHIGTKGLLAKAFQVYGSWTLDMDSMNATQVEYLQTEVLEHAVAAKELLIKIGVKPELNSTVEKLLVNMKVSASKKKSASAETAAQNNMLKLLAKIRP
jgi:outer membrane murein-binding lipoprotein Lpp